MKKTVVSNGKQVVRKPVLRSSGKRVKTSETKVTFHKDSNIVKVPKSKIPTVTPLYEGEEITPKQVEDAWDAVALFASEHIGDKDWDNTWDEIPFLVDLDLPEGFN